MLRFLKWIFFVFGGLALGIMIFFYNQNKKDLNLAWDYKSKMDYEEVSKNCDSPQKYLYPCFEKIYSEYVEKVSLTGLSIGLKFAFNFMDDDRENQNLYNKSEKDIRYSLNYLRLNNLTIKEAGERFHGYELLYGGYLSSIRDYLDGAKKFSEGIIEGLEGKEGIQKLEDESKTQSYEAELEQLKSDFYAHYKKAYELNEKRINELLAKNNQK